MARRREDGTSEWETIPPQWVIESNERLKKEGFKVQAAARFLIRRLSYDVLKAEEDVYSPAKMRILEGKLGRHLARYSDYIVRRSGHLYVIDVKAKEFSTMSSDGQKYTLFSESIFLSRKYVDTIIPVLALAVLYPTGLFGSSNMRNKKVYYILRDIGTQSRTDNGGVQIVLSHDLDGYRWTKATNFRKWIRQTRTNAENLIRMHHRFIP